MEVSSQKLFQHLDTALTSKLVVSGLFSLDKSQTSQSTIKLTGRVTCGTSCMPGIHTRSTSQHTNIFTLVINYNPTVYKTHISFLYSRGKLFTTELLKSATDKRWKISLKIIGWLASLWIKGLNKYSELAKIALKIQSSFPVNIGFARMVSRL